MKQAVRICHKLQDHNDPFTFSVIQLYRDKILQVPHHKTTQRQALKQIQSLTPPFRILPPVGGIFLPWWAGVTPTSWCYGRIWKAQRCFCLCAYLVPLRTRHKTASPACRKISSEILPESKSCTAHHLKIPPLGGVFILFFDLFDFLSPRRGRVCYTKYKRILYANPKFVAALYSH